MLSEKISVVIVHVPQRQPFKTQPFQNFGKMDPELAQNVGEGQTQDDCQSLGIDIPCEVPLIQLRFVGEYRPDSVPEVFEILPSGATVGRERHTSNLRLWDERRPPHNQLISATHAQLEVIVRETGDPAQLKVTNFGRHGCSTPSRGRLRKEGEFGFALPGQHVVFGVDFPRGSSDANGPKLSFKFLVQNFGDCAGGASAAAAAATPYHPTLHNTTPTALHTTPTVGVAGSAERNAVPAVHGAPHDAHDVPSTSESAPHPPVAMVAAAAADQGGMEVGGAAAAFDAELRAREARAAFISSAPDGAQRRARARAWNALTMTAKALDDATRTTPIAGEGGVAALRGACAAGVSALKKAASDTAQAARAEKRKRGGDVARAVSDAAAGSRDGRLAGSDRRAAKKARHQREARADSRGGKDGGRVVGEADDNVGVV